MKLRIQGNSIRLRLKQGEVDELSRHGRVADRLTLGPDGQHLDYGLEVDESASVLGLRSTATEITVLLPLERAAVWTSTELVGLDGAVDIGDEGEVTLLIEKDFTCLHQRPGEDESDNYPNPAADA
ncbi:MAG: hypothetical protein AAGC60_29105 [Acidobacteriota bacterium]